MQVVLKASSMYSVVGRLIIVTLSLLVFMQLSCVASGFSIAGREIIKKRTCRSMSETTSSTTATRTIRVLALHGSEGNKEEFTDRMEPLKSSLAKQGVDLVVTAIDAPFSKGNGLAWWTMPPGVRSFNAETYGGFEESATLVLDALKNPQQSPYDLIVGHSQGAILLASLLALQRIASHPNRGYILNGVAWPNPYSQQLDSLEYRGGKSPSRILFVVGENDKITPSSNTGKVSSSFDNAGLTTSTVRHDGGHGLPFQDEEALAKITDWVLNV
mmetsp:Transcript_27000/g.64464  ORF Transcript_27000/g.64464 Transcript_27000/m.64464 type:complete len:272 (-) Transcript_27000:296-1111(-)